MKQLKGKAYRSCETAFKRPNGPLSMPLGRRLGSIAMDLTFISPLIAPVPCRPAPARAARRHPAPGSTAFAAVLGARAVCVARRYFRGPALSPAEQAQRVEAKRKRETAQFFQRLGPSKTSVRLFWMRMIIGP